MDKSSCSVCDIDGDWIFSEKSEAGFIELLKAAWSKPISKLSNEEMATFLRQNIAVDAILPYAHARLESGFDDDSELNEGALKRAVSSHM